MGAAPEAAKVRRFEEQVLVHLGDLYRAALRLSGSTPDAEDLVQETCLRAFQALEQLRHPGAAKVWVFAILRSVFLQPATPGDVSRGIPHNTKLLGEQRQSDGAGLATIATSSLLEPRAVA